MPTFNCIHIQPTLASESASYFATVVLPSSNLKINLNRIFCKVSKQHGKNWRSFQFLSYNFRFFKNRFVTNHKIPDGCCGQRLRPHPLARPCFFLAVPFPPLSVMTLGLLWDSKRMQCRILNFFNVKYTVWFFIIVWLVLCLLYKYFYLLPFPWKK